MSPSLKILDVFYGNVCNLACNQCDVRSDIWGKGQHDKSLENILEGVDLAVKYFEIQEFSLLGGEPLLYKDTIIKILDHIKSFDTTTKINVPTNGMLLNKNLDFVANLIDKYNVMLQVSDHVSVFKNKSKSEELVECVHKLGKMLNLKTKPSVTYYTEYHDMNNKRQDPIFQKWIDIKTPGGYPEDDEEESSIYYNDGNKGIYYSIYDWFFANHYMDENNKPKPFNSPSAEYSYLRGCSSEFCSYMYDKKIYKCASLGTLQRFLKHHGVLDDPDWQKYLAYKPLDLTNCTQEEVENFSNTKHSCVKECTMCPATSDHKIVKTEEMVLRNLRNV